MSTIGRVIATQGHIVVRMLPGGLLQAEERDKFGRTSERSKHVGAWSIWRHELGYVLCPQLSAWCADRFPLRGDPGDLLDAGVQDCRERLVPIVDRLIDLAKLGGQQGAVVPFIVADDEYDANEALGAAKAFFHVSSDDGQDLRFALCSSNIPDWHEYRMQHQVEGSFDVAAGLFHKPLEKGESHDDWIKAVGDCYKHERGTRCVVIANAENLGRMEQGRISFNFGALLDSAIDRVWEWGCTAAVIGSWDAWLKLMRAGTGPLEHSYELVHIPSAQPLTAQFYRVMADEFRTHCGGSGENSGISEVGLSPEVAEAVWVAAGRMKDRALALVRTVVFDAERSGQSRVNTDDVLRLVADGCRIGCSPIDTVTTTT